MIRFCCALLFATLIWSQAVFAETGGRRVALVIGNSNYDTLPQLTNPASDATDVANQLAGLGFEVILGVDVSLILGLQAGLLCPSMPE